MVERARRPGFLLETGETLCVLAQGRREDLDCHITIEPRITRPIDLAHTAGADLRDDLVVGESLSDHQPSEFDRSGPIIVCLCSFSQYQYGLDR